MPKTRTIVATGGTDAALQLAIAAADPKRGKLSQIATDGLREIASASIAVIDFSAGKLAFFPTGSLAALTAKMNIIAAIAGVYITPADPTKSTSIWSWNLGYTPAVAGHPDYWLDDNGSQNPPDVPEVFDAPVSDEFAGAAVAVMNPTRPTLSMGAVIDRIEDAMASEAAIQAGRSGVVLIDQTNNRLHLAYGTQAAAQGQNITATAGALAIFIGTVTDSTGVIRQFGE